MFRGEATGPRELCSPCGSVHGWTHSMLGFGKTVAFKSKTSWLLGFHRTVYYVALPCHDDLNQYKSVRDRAKLPWTETFET